MAQSHANLVRLEGSEVAFNGNKNIHPCWKAEKMQMKNECYTEVIPKKMNQMEYELDVSTFFASNV